MPASRSAARAQAPRYLAVLAAFLSLAACVTTSTTVTPDQAPLPLPAALSGRAEPGPFEVRAESGEFTSVHGCTVEYQVFLPLPSGEPAGGGANPGAMPTVILAHGFMDSMDGTSGWARLWASYGMQTAVLNFCNSTWFNGFHNRNADDMMALADLLDATNIIYAGFSAGGLSALISADRDPHTVAYLGLDPVDSRDLADTALSYAGPSLFMFSEPSNCNADLNMVPKLSRIEGEIAVLVPYATHCDYRRAYSSDCEKLCGNVLPPEVADDIRHTIAVVATSWIVGQVAPDWLDVFEDGMIAELAALRRIARL